MKVEVTSTALPGLQAALRARAAAFVQGIYEAGQHVAGEAKELVQRGAKTGRIYRKTNPNRTHQASAPGQPPASDTGTLANSIGVERLPDRAEISAVTPYALPLEWGTRRMAPRPFMTRALGDNRDTIRRIVQTYVRRAGRV